MGELGSFLFLSNLVTGGWLGGRRRAKEGSLSVCVAPSPAPVTLPLRWSAGLHA